MRLHCLVIPQANSPCSESVADSIIQEGLSAVVLLSYCHVVFPLKKNCPTMNRQLLCIPLYDRPAHQLYSTPLVLPRSKPLINPAPLGQPFSFVPQIIILLRRGISSEGSSLSMTRTLRFLYFASPLLRYFVPPLYLEYLSLFLLPGQRSRGIWTVSTVRKGGARQRSPGGRWSQVIANA